MTSENAFKPFLNIFNKKKYIRLDSTSDSRPYLLKNNSPSIDIMDSSTPVEDGGGFVSLKDGFSDFLSGNSSSGYSVKPLKIKYSTISAQEFTVTYDSVPSLILLDESFNMYYVKDKGIKVDSEGRITNIETRPVSNPNVEGKNYQTEESIAVVNQTVISEQENWDYLNGIISSSSTFRTSGILDTINIGDYGTLLSSGEISSDEYSQIDLTVRSYNYSGSSDKDDNLKFQNALSTIEIISFPKFYIVDMRQFSDMLSEACSAGGFNDILTGMEIDEDDVSDIVSDTEICTDEFIESINNNINNLLQSIDDGVVPPFLSQQDFESIVSKYEECLEDIIDRLCRLVVNPLNSSFLLTKDITENEMDDIENPSDIEPEILADATGIEAPNITGASEYASGIGVSASYFVGEQVIIEIILRDSYDVEINHDFSSKIKINILKDETGSAVLSKFGNNDVYKEGNSYFTSIISNNSGKIDISASVCDKTMKAFTFEGLTIENEQVKSSEEGCVSDKEQITTQVVNNAPIGSLIRIDRVLSIIYEETEPASISLSETERGRIVTTPQEFGTKVKIKK